MAATTAPPPLTEHGRRERIVREARALFTSHGYAAVSMQQIATAAEINKEVMPARGPLSKQTMSRILLTDVARKLGDDSDPKGKKSKGAPPEPNDPSEAPKAPPRHPAGERQSKRQSALAENLRKWMAGRKQDG